MHLTSGIGSSTKVGGEFSWAKVIVSKSYKANGTHNIGEGKTSCACVCASPASKAASEIRAHRAGETAEERELVCRHHLSSTSSTVHVP